MIFLKDQYKLYSDNFKFDQKFFIIYLLGPFDIIFSPEEI